MEKLRFLLYIFLLFSVTCVYASEKKIILLTSQTQTLASKAINKTKPRISNEFKVALATANATLKIRKSGRMYILVIEPIADFQTAKKLKKLLPSPYRRSSFINNYSAPSKPSSDEILVDFGNTQVVKPSEVKADPKPVKQVDEKPTKEESKEKKSEAKIPDIKTDTPKTSDVKSDIEQDKKSVIPKIKEIEPKYQKPKKKQISQQNQPTIQKESLPRPKIIEDTGGITAVAEATKSGAASIVETLRIIIVDNLIYIAFIVLIFACFIYFLSMKKTYPLYKKISKLEKEKDEKAQTAESIQSDLRHLRSYYDSLMKSFFTPIKDIEEYFTKQEATPEIQNAQKAASNIVHLLDSYEELGGNITFDNREFNLNTLVKTTIKKVKTSIVNDVNIVADFDLPLLNKVVGDSQKLARVLSIFTKFICKYTKNGRVLISLIEASQTIEGDITISLIIKSNKNGIPQQAQDDVIKAFSINKASEATNLNDDAKDLMIARRLLQAMNGNVDFSENSNHECIFELSFQIIVINRLALQESLFSRRSNLNLDIVTLGDSKSSTKEVQRQLEDLNLDIKLATTWNEFSEKLNDIYFLCDLVIVENVLFDEINIASFFEKARRKNFAILVILEDHEIENSSLKEAVKIENSKGKENALIIKILKKPYNLSELNKILTKINESLVPLAGNV